LRAEFSVCHHQGQQYCSIELIGLEFTLFHLGWIVMSFSRESINPGSESSKSKLKAYVFTKGEWENRSFQIKMLVVWASTLEDARQKLKQSADDWESYHDAGVSDEPLGQPIAFSTKILPKEL
jgi:hypothetical protein